MTKMRKILKPFVRDERGVSALEYAIMAGIVVVALTAVGTSFTTSLTTLFTSLFSKITTASTSAS
jgi:pilus assembly protein Flp/PilA